MNLETQPYEVQRKRWPESGRVVLAHFDADTVIVYQAYKPSIGRSAAAHGHFGGADFSFSRMSWVKPNFLWMMYRSGWGTKVDQEVTLAIRLCRAGFDTLMREAVASTFDPSQHRDRGAWQHAVARSEIRRQWDPDHDPAGVPLERRAIQLGMRGATLQTFSSDWIVEITDVSDFVAAQRPNAQHRPFAQLVTPREEPYPFPFP